MLALSSWPTFDASKLVDTEVTVVASVNGKRGTEFTAPVDIVESELVDMAKAALGAKLDGATIIKTIVVPKKLVNFVIKK